MMDVKYGGWLRFALADWRFLRFKKGKLSGADDGLSFGFYFLVLLQLSLNICVKGQSIDG